MFHSGFQKLFKYLNRVFKSIVLNFAIVLFISGMSYGNKTSKKGMSCDKCSASAKNVSVCHQNPTNNAQVLAKDKFDARCASWKVERLVFM